MTIGTTTGDKPDYIDDADLLSLDEMRGAMKDISDAHLTNVEKATVAGVLDEINNLKQMMLEYAEQNNHLISLYSTMRNEFEVFKQNQIATLNLKVNHGSTTPED